MTRPTPNGEDMKMEKFIAKHFVPFILFLCFATFPAAHTSHQPSQNPFEKKHFVLVHGAGHGAWCWYKIATLLTAAGHNVTALDMAASGIDPMQLQQIHSIENYSEPLIKLMASLPPHDRVILVGHSFGGFPISLAMEWFPHKIAAAVFATAAMPGSAISSATISKEFYRDTDFMDTQYEIDEGSDKPANAVLFGPKFFASSLYQLSPPEDLTLALTLVRWTPMIRVELELTKERYGSVPRVFIMCNEDRLQKPERQLLMIKKNPPNEVKVINGSDHMVMFSRTLELFSNLHQIAQKYS